MKENAIGHLKYFLNKMLAIYINNAERQAPPYRLWPLMTSPKTDFWSNSTKMKLFGVS
jgi:hypothetical protein